MRHGYVCILLPPKIKSKRNKTKKEKCCMILLYVESKKTNKKEPGDTENKLVVAKSWGVGVSKMGEGDQRYKLPITR